MDFHHRMSLINNRVYLVENLVVNDLFLDYLIMKKIILTDHSERILAGVTSSDKVSEFLRTITRRGPDAWRLFMEALLVSGQHSIAIHLDKDLFRTIICDVLTLAILT